MSEATAQILYREVIGAGDDDENNNKENGIAVTLTYWSSSTRDFRLHNHYMLERKVMLNRKFIVDDITMQIENHSHSVMIRKAVEMVDYLIEQIPQVRDE